MGQNLLHRQFFGEVKKEEEEEEEGICLVIYLKIQQAHSGFHKGDQSYGFCQWPSFQAVMKPVNKLSTQVRLINNSHRFCIWKTTNTSG